MTPKKEEDTDNKGSCTCFWGKKMDLTLINSVICIACGKPAKPLKEVGG